ncbi:hypothetical protein [Microbacterium pumilum]|uniref:DUF4878 domain-containing protein n=1 Tax=Microbacterium pumilum TaxID=344165 RepID=A0ABN2SMH8_9MICO
MTPEPDERLLAPYRPVRRVGVEDVPWSGMLVRMAGGESRVLVDADQFAADWAGWAADPEGHVLTALDVARRADGHSLALPLCVERVADFLVRRSSSRVPLSLGEIVTLSVSLIRGVTEIQAAPRMKGQWWLTDAGRPVLVTDVSDAEAVAHTAQLLRTLEGDPRCDAALAAGARAVESERLSAHDLRTAEEQLFAVADPEPLATSLLGPRAARDFFAVDREPATAIDDDPRPFTWVDTIARHVDADLADVVSRATTGVWRRLRRPRATSRKPWMLAAAAAAAVLAAGLLWPTGAGGPATAETQGSDPTAPVRTPTAKTPSPTAGTSVDAGGGAAPADLVAVANALLAARTTCAGEVGCLAGVVLDPAAAFDAGAIDLDPSQRTTTLLDDFGGMAVLRVDGADGAAASQLVVVMLDDDRWLLRDVHLAKQP